ncbi:MAG: hypothetical protein ACJ751_11455 [Niastella sp.]|uniref:hypothetical protein n=1 Tax=Niastella sp. TaxID=1869183 RepID=UPI00389A3A8E
MIITNQPYMLETIVDWYNKTYKTDFVIDHFVKDEVFHAILSYEKADDFHVFQLGVNFGRENEAFDKRITNFLPPDYFDDRTKFPRE